MMTGNTARFMGKIHRIGAEGVFDDDKFVIRHRDLRLANDFTAVSIRNIVPCVCISNTGMKEGDNKIRWLIRQAYGFRDRGYIKRRHKKTTCGFLSQVVDY